jgi:hypothetical protein
MVTCSFKRRTASRQAENHTAEGIEPRKEISRKDDTVQWVEVNMGITVNGKGMFTSSGSETLACLTLGLCGNLGGPAISSRKGSMPDNRKGRKANGAQGVGWSRSTDDGG